MEDEKIIAKLWCRDESALLELERAHKKLCLSQALRITENISDAEECWNDTCLAVWNSIPPTRPVSLKAYVIRIIRNISLNFVKAQQTEKRSAIIVELDDCVCDNLPDMEQSEIGALIDEFLETLPKAEAMIFMRRYFCSEAVKDIAVKLECKENQASKILVKLRKKLKKHLTERGIAL